MLKNAIILLLMLYCIIVTFYLLVMLQFMNYLIYMQSSPASLVKLLV